jgi:hypothetical protein
VQRRETGLYRAPPELWPQLGGGEVRGPTSTAVSTGVAGTAAVAVSAGEADSTATSAGSTDSAAVELVMALPVPGVQKPPRWVGKRFWDRFEAAPLKV